MLWHLGSNGSSSSSTDSAGLSTTSGPRESPRSDLPLATSSLTSVSSASAPWLTTSASSSVLHSGAPPLISSAASPPSTQQFSLAASLPAPSRVRRTSSPSAPSGPLLAPLLVETFLLTASSSWSLCQRATSGCLSVFLLGGTWDRSSFLSSPGFSWPTLPALVKMRLVLRATTWGGKSSSTCDSSV